MQVVLSVDMAPGQKAFIFPYTLASQYRQFHWQWYWKNARSFRFLVYSFVISLPLIMKINKGG